MFDHLFKDDEKAQNNIKKLMKVFEEIVLQLPRKTILTCVLDSFTELSPTLRQDDSDLSEGAEKLRQAKQRCWTQTLWFLRRLSELFREARAKGIIKRLVLACPVAKPEEIDRKHKGKEVTVDQTLNIDYDQ
jgi:hypothetical protein